MGSGRKRGPIFRTGMEWGWKGKMSEGKGEGMGRKGEEREERACPTNEK